MQYVRRWARYTIEQKMHPPSTHTAMTVLIKPRILSDAQLAQRSAASKAAALVCSAAAEIGYVDSSGGRSELVDASRFTIFMAKEAGHVGDYHGNFDWPVFYKWVMHRLFPALTRCYPNCFGPYATETVAIIMDTASYHAVDGLH